MTLFGAAIKSVKYTDKKRVENQVLDSLIPLLLYSQDENDAVAKVMPTINLFLNFTSKPKPNLQIRIHIFEGGDFVVPSLFIIATGTVCLSIILPKWIVQKSYSFYIANYGSLWLRTNVLYPLKLHPNIQPRWEP